MSDEIRTSLAAVYDPGLVDELLEAHSEAKRNYYLGGLRLSEVEGGRFAEAAFRLLQQETSGKFTRLGASLKTEPLIRTLENLPRGSYPDSIRLHIPRALRVVYDVRSNRDAAHLGDGIDPNVQDATLVVGILDWVLAEFVRLHHSVSADEAQGIVNDLVTRATPAVQYFGDFPKLLDSELSASDQCEVLLYDRGSAGAEYRQLEQWVHPRSRANLRRTLWGLVHDKAFVHFDGERYFITWGGQKDAELRRLVA